MRKTVLVIIVAAAGWATACSGPAHMTRAYGRSYQEHLSRQVAMPAAVEEAEKGLDSEEASIIAGAYRKSLVPKGTREEEGRGEVLLVAPSGNTRPAPLAPSVPKE